jgi:hypothetical protein
LLPNTRSCSGEIRRDHGGPVVRDPHADDAHRVVLA